MPSLVDVLVREGGVLGRSVLGRSVLGRSVLGRSVLGRSVLVGPAMLTLTLN